LTIFPFSTVIHSPERLLCLPKIPMQISESQGMLNNSTVNPFTKMLKFSIILNPKTKLSASKCRPRALSKHHQPLSQSRLHHKNFNGPTFYFLNLSSFCTFRVVSGFRDFRALLGNTHFVTLTGISCCNDSLLYLTKRIFHNPPASKKWRFSLAVKTNISPSIRIKKKWLSVLTISPARAFDDFIVES